MMSSDEFDKKIAELKSIKLWIDSSSAAIDVQIKSLENMKAAQEMATRFSPFTWLKEQK